MGRLVHFYAVAGSWQDHLSGPEITGSQRAKDTGAIGIRVENVADFKFQLQNLKKLNIKMDRMVIETHGSPGAVYFGNDPLNVDTLIAFKAQGFEELFEENARVFLNGCNIAESECSTGTCGPEGNGRKFLLDFARIFLFKGGGRVGASTSKGLPFFNSKVYHLWGTTIYAYIAKGGGHTRFAVGDELATPVGAWKVNYSPTEEEFYLFNSDRSVKWNDGKLIGGKSGKGKWSTTSANLQIAWDSGSSELWDLPLFTQEQPTVWKKPNGDSTSATAEKIESNGRWFD